MHIPIWRAPFFTLSLFVGAAWADAGELTEAAYKADSATKGVVLLDVDLGRYGMRRPNFAVSLSIECH
jgi:hypothetical protein